MSSINFKFFIGQLRYNNDPIDKTTFEIGSIKKNKRNKLIKIMMLRDNESEVPVEKRKWEVCQVKTMVMRSMRSDGNDIHMEYVELKPYFITAEQHKNPHWTDTDENNYQTALQNDTSLAERRKGYHPNILKYN